MSARAYEGYEDQIIPERRKRNPLVLVGCLATAGVLGAGLVAFKTGRSGLSQKMMRARVLFQAATVGLMVAGGAAATKLDPEKSKGPAL